MDIRVHRHFQGAKALSDSPWRSLIDLITGNTVGMHFDMSGVSPSNRHYMELDALKAEFVIYIRHCSSPFRIFPGVYLNLLSASAAKYLFGPDSPH